MTLREKFSLILMEFWSSDWESKCEKIADEFAIGFAKWFHSNYQNQGIQLYTKFGKWEKQTIEEVLEIYKKEKGL